MIAAVVPLLALAGFLCPVERPVACGAGRTTSCHRPGTSCECIERSATSTCHGTDPATNARFIGECNYATAVCEQPMCMMEEAEAGCSLNPNDPNACASRCEADEIPMRAPTGNWICFPQLWNGEYLSPTCVGMLALRATDPTAELAGTVTCPATGDVVASFLDCPCPADTPVKCAAPDGYRCYPTSMATCPDTPCAHPVTKAHGVCNFDTGVCGAPPAAATAAAADKSACADCPVPECPASHPTRCPGSDICIDGDCACQSPAVFQQHALCRQFECRLTGTLVPSPALCPCPENLPTRCVGPDGVTCVAEGAVCDIPRTPCGANGEGTCDFASGHCKCPPGHTGPGCEVTALQTPPPHIYATAQPTVLYDPATGKLTAQLYECKGNGAMVTRMSDCPCPAEAPTRCAREGAVDCFSEDVRCECAGLLVLDTVEPGCGNVTCPTGEVVGHAMDCPCPAEYPKKCLNPTGYSCEEADAACPYVVPCLDGRGVCDLATGVCMCSEGLTGTTCEVRGPCEEYTCIDSTFSDPNGIVTANVKDCPVTCPAGTSACPILGDEEHVLCLPDAFECGCAGPRFMMPFTKYLASNFSVDEYDCKEYTGQDVWVHHPLECPCAGETPKKCLTYDGPYCIPEHERCGGWNSLLHNCSVGCDLYHGTCSDCDELYTCHGRGHCTQQASAWACECFQDEVRGHWSEAHNCSICADGWYGPDCTVSCVTLDCGAHGDCVDGECVCRQHENGEGGFDGTLCDRCIAGWRLDTNCTVEESYVYLTTNSHELIYNGLEYSFNIEVFYEDPFGLPPDVDFKLRVDLPLHSEGVTWVVPAACAFYGYPSGTNGVGANASLAPSNGVFCDLGTFVYGKWEGTFAVNFTVEWTGTLNVTAELVQGIDGQPITGASYAPYPLIPEPEQPTHAVLQATPEIPLYYFDFNRTLLHPQVDKNFTFAPLLNNSGPGYAVLYLELSFPQQEIAVDDIWTMPRVCNLTANTSHTIFCKIVLNAGEQWVDNEFVIRLDRLAPGRPDGWHVPDTLDYDVRLWNHHQHRIITDYDINRTVEEPYVAVLDLKALDAPEIGYTHSIEATMEYPRQSAGSDAIKNVTVLIEIFPSLRDVNDTRELIAVPATLAGTYGGAAITWTCDRVNFRLHHKIEATVNDTEPLGFWPAETFKWVCMWRPASPLLPDSGNFTLTIEEQLSASMLPDNLLTRVTAIEPVATLASFKKLARAELEEFVPYPSGRVVVEPDVVRPGFQSNVSVFVEITQHRVAEVRLNVSVMGAQLVSVDGNCSVDPADADAFMCDVAPLLLQGQTWGTSFIIAKALDSETPVAFTAQGTVYNYETIPRLDIFGSVVQDPVLPEIGLAVGNTTDMFPGFMTTVSLNLSVLNQAIANATEVTCNVSGMALYEVVRADRSVVAYSGLAPVPDPWPATTTPTPPTPTGLVNGVGINVTGSSFTLSVQTLTWLAGVDFEARLLVEQEPSGLNMTCHATTLQDAAGDGHIFIFPFTPAPLLELDVMDYTQPDAWTMTPFTFPWQLSQTTELDAKFANIRMEFYVFRDDGSQSWLYNVSDLTTTDPTAVCTREPPVCYFEPIVGSWSKNGTLIFYVVPEAQYVNVFANVTSTPGLSVPEDSQRIDINLPLAQAEAWPTVPLVQGAKADLSFDVDLTIEGKGTYTNMSLYVSAYNVDGDGLTVAQSSAAGFPEGGVCANGSAPGVNASEGIHTVCHYPDFTPPAGYQNTITVTPTTSNPRPVTVDVELVSDTFDQNDWEGRERVGFEVWPFVADVRIGVPTEDVYRRDLASTITVDVRNHGHALSVAKDVNATLSIAPGANLTTNIRFDTANLPAACTSAGIFQVTCGFGDLDGVATTNRSHVVPILIDMHANDFCMNWSLVASNWDYGEGSVHPAHHNDQHCFEVLAIPYQEYRPTIAVTTELYDPATTSYTLRNDVVASAQHRFRLNVTDLPTETQTSTGLHGYDTFYFNVSFTPTSTAAGGVLQDANVFQAPEFSNPSSSCTRDTNVVGEDRFECSVPQDNSGAFHIDFQAAMYAGLSRDVEVRVVTWARGTDHNDRKFPEHHFVDERESNEFAFAFPRAKKGVTIVLDYSEKEVVPGMREELYVNITNMGEATEQFWIVAELHGDMQFASTMNMVGRMVEVSYPVFIDHDQHGLVRTSYSSWPTGFVERVNETLTNAFPFIAVPQPARGMVDASRTVSVAQMRLAPGARTLLPILFDVYATLLTPSVTLHVFHENADELFVFMHNMHTSLHSADVELTYYHDWQLFRTGDDYFHEPHPGQNNVTIVVKNIGEGWAKGAHLTIRLPQEGMIIHPLEYHNVTASTPYLLSKCTYDPHFIECRFLGQESVRSPAENQDRFQPDPLFNYTNEPVYLPHHFEIPLSFEIVQYFHGRLDLTVEYFTVNDNDLSNNLLHIDPVIRLPDLIPVIVYPTWPETAYELRIYNDGPVESINVRAVISVENGIFEALYDTRVVHPHYDYFDASGEPDPPYNLILPQDTNVSHPNNTQDCIKSESGDFYKCFFETVPFDPARQVEDNYIARFFEIASPVWAQLEFEGTITIDDRNAANNQVIALCPERLLDECFDNMRIVQVTGCSHNLWPSTYNCPADGSASITIWGKGFGLQQNAQTRAWIGDGECRQLDLRPARDVMDDPIWNGYQVLICDNYLGQWSEGDPSFWYNRTHREGPEFAITVQNYLAQNHTDEYITVNFAFDPVVERISGCGETPEYWKGCHTAGHQPLQIWGSHFRGYHPIADTVPSGFGHVEVWFKGEEYEFECLNLEVVNDTLIVCYDYPGNGTHNVVRVRANSYWDRSPNATYMHYRPIPWIRAVEGCWNESRYHTTHCHRSGMQANQTLLIVGRNLWLQNKTTGELEVGQVTIGGHYCPNVTRADDYYWNEANQSVLPMNESDYFCNFSDPGFNWTEYNNGSITCLRDLTNDTFRVLRCDNYTWDEFSGQRHYNVPVQVIVDEETSKQPAKMSFSDLRVERITGCIDIHPSTINCHSNGQQPITMYGRGFGDAGARVWLGPYECERVRHGVWLNDTHRDNESALTTDEVLVCENYMTPTLYPTYANVSEDWVHPYIVTQYGMMYWEKKVGVAFQRRPEIHTVDGCRWTDPTKNHTKGCFTNGTNELVVTGRNFIGERGFGTAYLFIGPYKCQRQVTVSDTEIHCLDYPGQGANLRVEVRKSILGLDPYNTTMVEYSGSRGVAQWVAKNKRGRFLLYDTAARWLEKWVALGENLLVDYRVKPKTETIGGCGCSGFLLQYGDPRCDMEGDNHTVMCSTSGDTRLTITGSGFGQSGAQAWVGTRDGGVLSVQAGEVIHDFYEPDSLLYVRDYPFIGGPHMITIVQDDEESDVGFWAGEGIYVSYYDDCPYWSRALNAETQGAIQNGTRCNSQGLCERSCSTAPPTCICNNDPILGFWGGRACQDCKYGYWGVKCNKACTGGTGNPCNGNGMCDFGLLGDGTCDCYAGYAGLACEKACPRDAQDRICGGHLSACSNGTLGTGVCTCPWSAAEGYWQGDACDECKAGWWGGCRKECPGGSVRPCNGNGVCDDGPDGSGRCICFDGYAGEQCEIACVGGAASPCNFHGDCSPVDGSCTCYANMTHGFWTEDDCSVCAPGWSAPTSIPVGCITECPRDLNDRVCGNVGRCEAGICFCPDEHPTTQQPLCGVACNVTGTPCSAAACPKTYWGPNCEFQCDGTALDNFGVSVECSGHGLCHGGKEGSGVCNCDPGYGGKTCQECPGGANSPCSNNGVCSKDTGRCTCYSGYAGSSCQIPCKGGVVSPCSNQGTCFDGANGDGTCTCDYGWLGDLCDEECPGGAKSPCNNNGNCTAQGTCLCEMDDFKGYWGGESCDECAMGYVGEDCTRKCPSTLNGTCNGHGECASNQDICRCDNTAVTGFWDGTACEDCELGYWGASCTGVCPGGVCNPCSGHGVCNGGVMGNGTCQCVFNNTGYWGLPDCANCHPGYYGPLCSQLCPGGAEEPCSGHGRCDDGTLGLGTCECFRDPITGDGVWGGFLCDDCARGWYGPKCDQQCPFFNGKTCGGKGDCDDGVAGTGVCECFQGSAGANCEKICPRDSLNRICGGFTEACDDSKNGTGTCSCPQNTEEGYWLEPACEQCRSGYAGPQCKIECPGGAAQPCSNRGICYDGKLNDGTCKCDFGYSGVACEQPCPGGEGNQCNRRGDCVDGACDCFRNNVDGHWDGETCDVCFLGWSGQSCTIRCPMGDGLPCSGRGTCHDGECYGCVNSCGDACQLQDTDCDSLKCEPARWGVGCVNTCKGTIVKTDGTYVGCSGQGSCSEGVEGSGECVCHSGYAGEGCSLTCSGGADNPCSGHGACDRLTGACTCSPYFATADCSEPCKGYGKPEGVCFNRGVCSDGASGTGACTCEAGYAGEACGRECPGGRDNPCSGQGLCDQVTATCKCYDTDSLGHFSGQTCNSCKGGYFGPECMQICPTKSGTTVGYECACLDGWAGIDCSIECKGGAATPCTRNGKCNATNAGDGTCTCKTGFRGEDCRLQCAGFATTGLECSGHGVCDSLGACACYADDEKGYWLAPDCAACEGDYYGSNCNQLCPKGLNGLFCSGNGRCSATRGVCECNADAEKGYWAGALCGACQDGFYGARCTDACPGGACNPCTGHGVCSDGVLGSGLCRCDDSDEGRWAGDACEACQQGYWGDSCAGQCPVGTTPETWCSGHGVCSEGVLGSGDCLCFRTPARGWWGGDLCNDCAKGYFGPDCKDKCPGEPIACSGNGECDDGVAGSGVCQCDRGASGVDCYDVCPRGANGDFCSGAIYDVVGGVAIPACDDGADGTGTCNCPGFSTLSGDAHGFLDGLACERCRPGYAGVDCKTPCPGVENGLVCSDHGICEDGKTGSGLCVCDYGYAGDSCDVVCTGGAQLPCSGRGECQQGDPGPPLIVPGSCVCAAGPDTGYWALPDCAVCQEGWSGRDCTKKCPTSPSGVVCSGRGECLEGVCYCTRNGATPICGDYCQLSGYDACTDLCEVGYWGNICQNECLGGAASPCSNNGLCNDGRDGDGTCSCFTGYAGEDCSKVCDGGQPPATPPCSGSQGVCDLLTGKCACLPGFAMFDCSVECAGGAGNICNGHGVCSEGSTGDGSCDCEPGFAGLDCGSECAGGADNPCNGHGQCSPDTGICACYTDAVNGFWTGDACDRCIDGYTGFDCLSLCAYGDSIDGVCVCHVGYAGVDCTIECLGFLSEGSEVPCSGHGTCNDGNAGDGTCTCAEGYVGASCNLQCPGTITACSGHGVCAPLEVEGEVPTEAVCTCEDTDLGHYAGDDCSVCGEGWFGAACTETCPSALEHPTLCSGHGECDPLRIQCNCFSNTTSGFWTGDACNECSPGHWGANCENECMGGACNPCGGHGICFEGKCPDGICEPWRGTCNCSKSEAEGFWMGANCGECMPGYWSSSCSQECPGGIDKICSGRGTCSEGQYGTGQCNCDYQSDLGFWGRDACEDCAIGFWGDDCINQCPGTNREARTTCNGHGNCDDGQTGLGACTCDAGYAGPACAIACPRTKLTFMKSPVVCAGHGKCDDGTEGDGMCTCTTDLTQGRWIGYDCAACARGYWGENCINECTGGAAVPCNGHGVCDEGVYGAGTCKCDFGWSKADCSRECDGGAGRPCSGNGLCRAEDGKCDCYASPATGYWAGESCGECAYGWSGTQCDMMCPRNSTADDPGLPCSGLGECRDGACYNCREGHCNSLTAMACEEVETCSVRSCPFAGQWGPNCEYNCPGGVGLSTCSGNGLCSDGKLGTGLCSCNPGFMYADCSIQCPGGADNPCNKKGVCNTVDGSCECFPGYADIDCNVECRGGYHNPCNGHGRCADGALNDGTCDCDYGWAGEACDIECTGGADNPCTGHGVCSKEDGTCTCDSNAVAGFWQGDVCDTCEAGYFEANCTDVCYNGVTIKAEDAPPGGVCWCDQSWATADCSKPCPVGNDTDTGVPKPCSGVDQGYCMDGHTNDGTCVCMPNYYTENCGVFCHPDDCTELAHAQCDFATGQCECQDDEDGHWAGPTCDECKLFWWGDLCTEPCACNGNGGCERGTGVCQCFMDPTRGFWDGEGCDKCADGYVGFDCLSQDVRITRTTDVNTPVRFDIKVNDVGMHLPDQVYKLAYVGGRPVMLWNTTNNELLDNVDLGSAMVDGWFDPNYVYIVTDNSLIFKFYRGMTSLTQAGEPVLSGSGLSVDSIVSGSSRRFKSLARIPPVGEHGVYDPSTAKELLSMMPVGEELNIPANATAAGHHRGFATLDTLGLSLVTSLLDEDQDIAYLVWSGANARQVYYQRSSTLALVRIVDLTNYLDVIKDAKFLKRLGKLCVTGRKNDAWEIIMLSTPTLEIESFASKYQVSDCATCRDAGKAVWDGGQYIFVAMSITGGLRLVRLDLTSTLSEQYDVYRDQGTNDIHCNDLLVDSLSNAGYLFAHKGTEPSGVFKFKLDTLRVYGTASFFSSGTSVERIISASLMPDTREIHCLTQMGAQSKIIKLNSFALWSFEPDIADSRGGTLITVRGEGFVNFDQTCCRFGDGQDAIVSKAVQNTGTEIICQVPPDPKGGGGSCGGQVLEITLLGGAACSVDSPLFSRNLLTVQRVPTATITNLVPTHNVYQGNSVVTVNGIGFADSRFLKCKFFSAEKPALPPLGDALISGKNQEFALEFPTHETHSVTYVNSFQILCKQPPSYASLATLQPAYLEVSLDGQLYSEGLVEYAIYGKPAGLRVHKPAVFVRAGLEAVVEPILVSTVDSSGHELGVYDQDEQKVPYERDISVELVNLQVDESSNQATAIETQQLEAQTMTNGELEFINITLLSPPTGAVDIEFTHKLLDFRYNSTLGKFESYVIDTWKVAIQLVVESGDAVMLNIFKQPSNITSPTTDLPLSVQPELEFYDAAHNVITKPTQSAIGVSAELKAYVWKDQPSGNSTCGPGLCPCLPADLMGLNYSWTPPDAEVCWSTLKSSVSSPTFMDKFGKVQFRSIKLVGYHGVIYRLQFKVTVPSDLGAIIQPALSNFIHVGRCTPTSTTYARLMSEECLPCPPDAVCNGTTTIKPIKNAWRSNNVSTVMFPCTGDGVCNADTRCNVTGCEEPCAEGHKGVMCSVCEKEYGKAGAKCKKCPKETITVVVFIMIAVLAVLCFVVRSNLKIKARREKNLPILIKMFISHLQVSSRVGEFGTAFPGLMAEIFSAQSSASSLSFDNVYLDCAGGGGMSQYPKFLAYMFVPLGIIGLSFLMAVAIVNIRRVEDAIEARKKAAEMERRRRERLAQKGLNMNYYGIANDMNRDSDSDASSDSDMDPKTLALMGNNRDNDSGFEEEEEIAEEEGGENVGVSIAKPKKHKTDYRPSSARFSDEPRKANESNVDEFAEIVPTSANDARRQSLTDVQRRRLERGRGMLQTWLLAFIIVLYFVYPNLIQESSQMLRCRGIHWEDDLPHRWPDSERPEVATYKPGIGRVENYLAVDMGINCGHTEYKYYRTLALIFVVGYGFGIPMLAVAIIRVAIIRKNFVSASRSFGFLLMGYRPERWYWEAIVMIRKLMIVLLVVFIEDKQLQTYVGMWVMTVALVVHLWCQPYDSRTLAHLESFSLAVIVATLNFSLLYHWDLDPLYMHTLTALLAFMTLAVIVVFVYFMAKEGLRKLGEIITKLTGGARRSLSEKRSSLAAKLFGKPKPKEEDEKPKMEMQEVEQVGSAGTRMITHASTLPNFDRLTLLSKLFVLRGGLAKQDDGMFFDDDDDLEEEEPAPQKVPARREWRGQGIVAGDTLPGTGHRAAGPEPQQSPPAPLAIMSDSGSSGHAQPGYPAMPPVPAPASPMTPEAPERLAGVLESHRSMGSNGAITDDVVEDIINVMQITENTRFTRQQAKDEAVHGNVIHAAYMFCHLKNEEVTSAAGGITDKDAQDHLDDMHFGKKWAFFYGEKGRDLSTSQFAELWAAELNKYMT